MATPYFREWSNMRFHKGKSFLSPPRLFRSDRALYFPNFHGDTLLKENGLARDTTPLLMDRISVVSVFSSAWAERQAASFIGKKENPELHSLLAESKGRAQIVNINLEDNWLKAGIIKLFVPNLRIAQGKENWGRYFIVRRMLNDEDRDHIGLLNSKVGYTYLVDGNCRIRWAGSGIAEGDEKEGLVRGVKKLLDEQVGRKAAPAGPAAVAEPEAESVEAKKP
jgi:ATPase complex subunit ATP10